MTDWIISKGSLKVSVLAKLREKGLRDNKD